MHNKKAQVTIFIIVAIIIVAGVLIFFALNSNIVNPFSPGAEKIKTVVEDCIQSTGEEVVYQVTEGGGYYLESESSTESGVPYYYLNNERHMPSKEEIEEEINFWVSETLFFCTKNFIDFPEYEIYQGEIKVRSEILNEEVKLRVTYPLTIVKGEDSSTIKKFKDTLIESRLGITYDAIKEFIEESQEAICLSCLLEIVEKNDLSVNMADYDETTVIFFFRNELNEESPTFIFANKYHLEDE